MEDKRKNPEKGDVVVSATLGFSICFIIMSAILIVGVAIFGP
jgi:hypothetical protein